MTSLPSSIWDLQSHLFQEVPPGFCDLILFKTPFSHFCMTTSFPSSLNSSPFWPSHLKIKVLGFPPSLPNPAYLTVSFLPSCSLLVLSCQRFLISCDLSFWAKRLCILLLSRKLYLNLDWIKPNAQRTPNNPFPFSCLTLGNQLLPVIHIRNPNNPWLVSFSSYVECFRSGLFFLPEW